MKLEKATHHRYNTVTAVLEIEHPSTTPTPARKPQAIKYSRPWVLLSAQINKAPLDLWLGIPHSLTDFPTPVREETRLHERTAVFDLDLTRR